MKILHVAATFPPKSYGGITSASFNLANALARRGHSITVFTTDFRDKSSRIPRAKFVGDHGAMEVQYFMNLSNRLANERIFLPIRLASATSKVLRSFDIVHLHDFRSLISIAVHRYATRYRVPYVLQAHGSAMTLFQRAVIKRAFDDFWGFNILSDATRLIATSPAEILQYEAMGSPRERITLVPNGIDVAEYANLPERGDFRKKLGISGHRKVVLFIGRLHRTKGVDILVEAFAQVANQMGEVALVIVGPDDGHLQTVRRLAERLGLSDKVFYVPGVYGREKLSAYVDADIFVLPSRYEIFGIVALESIMCGVPTVVTDACGIAPMVLQEQMGYVARHDDESDLGRIIAEGLRHPEESDLMVERGKRYITNNLSWDRIAATMETIYLESMSQLRR